MTRVLNLLFQLCIFLAELCESAAHCFDSLANKCLAQELDLPAWTPQETARLKELASSDIDYSQAAARLMSGQPTPFPLDYPRLAHECIVAAHQQLLQETPSRGAFVN